MTVETRIYAEVRLLDVPFGLDKPYAYFVPAALKETALPGALVTVPFGGANRKTAGVITGYCDIGDLDEDKVKPLLSVSAAGVILDGCAMEICSFLCSYTLCTFGEAVRAVTPSAVTRLCECYSVCEEKEIRENKKLTEKAVLIYNYSPPRGTVQLGTLKMKFGEDTPELLLSLIKLKLIKKEIKTKDKSNVRYKTFVSAAAEALPGNLRSPVQAEILKQLTARGTLTSEELSAYFGKNVSPQLTSLEKKGLITLEKVQDFRNPYLEGEQRDDASPLSEEQTAAYEKINEVYSKGEAAACLLHGVTGSGKTRVIKAMIEKMDHVRRREMARLDDHASSGSAEGFNTKIRLLIKQSYGIRDFKYLRLKIHDLPSRRIKTHI